MSLIRGIATVGGFTLVSRVLGFARDMLIAGMLGAGPIADAFFVALRLPNLFRALTAEGAFTSAFVPIFSRLLAGDGRIAAIRFAEETLAVLIAALAPFLILVEIAMPAVVAVIAPGFVDDPRQMELAIAFTRLTFPYLLLITLVAFMGGVLNALGRFSAMAAAPILLNVCLILALALMTPYFRTAGHALSLAVAVAGIFQFLLLALACRGEEVTFRLRRPRLTPEVRRLLRQMGPAALGAGVTQINLLIGTILATLLADGAVSYLYYADRVAQLPLGVVGAAVATALLPTMARLLVSDAEAAIAAQNRAVEVAAMLALPAAFGLAALAEPIVVVLFQRGAFGAEATAATAAALTAYAAGLPAFVLVKALAPGFLARHDTATPVKIAAASILANIAANLALMPYFGHVGIALGTSIASWINAAGLWWILARRRQFHLDARSRRHLPLMFMAAIVMAASVWGGATLIGPGLTTTALRIAGVVASIGLGVAVYGIVLAATGAATWGELKRALRRS